jgi:hypothetical protein
MSAPATAEWRSRAGFRQRSVGGDPRGAGCVPRASAAAANDATRGFSSVFGELAATAFLDTRRFLGTFSRLLTGRILRRFWSFAATRSPFRRLVPRRVWGRGDEGAPPAAGGGSTAAPAMPTDSHISKRCQTLPVSGRGAVRVQELPLSERVAWDRRWYVVCTSIAFEGNR